MLAALGWIALCEIRIVTCNFEADVQYVALLEPRLLSPLPLKPLQGPKAKVLRKDTPRQQTSMPMYQGLQVTRFAICFSARSLLRQWAWLLCVSPCSRPLAGGDAVCLQDGLVEQYSNCAVSALTRGVQSVEDLVNTNSKNRSLTRPQAADPVLQICLPECVLRYLCVYSNGCCSDHLSPVVLLPVKRTWENEQPADQR